MAKHLASFFGDKSFEDFTYFNEHSYHNYDVLLPVEIEQLANVYIDYKKNFVYINQRQKVLILLLGLTGCRIGEALELKWENVFSTPPHAVFTDTKNGYSRAVPLADFLFELLQQLPRTSEYVFRSARNGNLNEQQLNLDLKRRAKACGINKRIWNHLFRHSFITTMLEAGVDVSDVAIIVGHRDLNSTMRYKNSLIDHYGQVLLAHPLLKQHITFEQLSKRIASTITKMVDTDKFDLRIDHGTGKIAIKVKNK